MNLENFLLISAVGFLASYVHLVIGLWAPRIGLPQLNLSKAMSNLSFGSEENERSPYVMGMIIVQLNGVMFALLYGTLVGQYLPGPMLVKGLIWAGILLVMSQLFFVSIFLQEGVFLSKLHPRAWMSAVLCHGLYGAILGWMCPIV